MSGDNREIYHHDHYFLRDQSTFSFTDDLSNMVMDPQLMQPYLSFPDCLQGGSTDYSQIGRGIDMSSPSLDLFGPRDGEKPTSKLGVKPSASAAAAGNTSTPNSSVSSYSSEGAGEEDSVRSKKEQQKEEEEEEQSKKQLQDKGEEDGGDKSKKVSKPRKKGEKRQREPRFAFMTKSEVDHLEDGYRWRKYGQKAVKNSPYPRSYYRCTTQKCGVKKRVERSYQDPTIVITTYEGQHTHQSPATIRGNSHILAPPQMMPSNFHGHDLWMHQLPQMNNNNQQMVLNPSMYMQSLPSPHQHLNLSDYGLLQDIVPSFVNTNHP